MNARLCLLALSLSLTLGCPEEVPAPAPMDAGDDASAPQDMTQDVPGEPLDDMSSPDATQDMVTQDMTAQDMGDVFDMAAPLVFAPTYPIEALHSEGGIYDVAEHAFYVGSLADGSVRRVDAQTGEEVVVFKESAPGLWWTLGMDLDPERGTLWVCAMEDLREVGDGEPAYAGYVWGFDLETQERTTRFALGDLFEGATCTDVAVAKDGSVYVGDRENPNIYRIGADGVGSLFVTDALFEGNAVGQNALLVLPDQSALLSLVYLPSRLLHVTLPQGEVTEVDIDRYFFDSQPLLSGADGMAWGEDGALLVAFTSQLNRLTPRNGSWLELRSEKAEIPEGITDVIQTPGGSYILNGQAAQFAFGIEPEPGVLRRFDGEFERP